MDLGLFLLRTTVGLTLAAHGAQKLFGWFGGHGLDAIGQGFERLGFRPGRRHAVMAGMVEFAGGMLLALGLLTPLGGALGASVMLVAALAVHRKNGFFVTGGGYEYNLVLGVAALTPAFTGPGSLSLDALLQNPLGGLAWGLAAAIVAVVGALGQLAQRHVTVPETTTA
jgi:putative oxidoreductase